VTFSAQPGGTVTSSHVSGDDIAEGDSITVTATADKDWVFVGWELNGIDVSTLNPATFPITAPTAILGKFSHDPHHDSFDVSYIASQGGTVTSTVPNGGLARWGTDVRFTAAAEFGWAFASWRVNGQDGGSANPLTITIEGPVTVEGVFRVARGTGYWLDGDIYWRSSDRALRYRIEKEDPASTFAEARVDGKRIDRNAFESIVEIAESTTLIFTAAYLDKLAAGAHTFAVRLSDDLTSQSPFTVIVKEEPSPSPSPSDKTSDEPTSPADPDDSDEDSPDDPTLASTGADSKGISVGSVSSVFAAAGLALLAWARKRARSAFIPWPRHRADPA
jgi:hypothetical protein